MAASSANKRTPFQRARDRLLITELYCQGISQYGIADRIGVSQPQVNQDLAAIRAEWLASRNRLQDEHAAEQLAKIDTLEREYWSEYFRSKDPFKKTVQRAERTRGKDAKGNETEGLKPAGAVVTTEERLGDPRYLAGVQWCVEQRCKILGLYAPTRIAIEQLEDEIRRQATELGLDGQAAVEEAHRIINGVRNGVPL